MSDLDAMNSVLKSTSNGTPSRGETTGEGRDAKLLQRLLKLEDEAFERASQGVEFSKPILYHGEKPIIYPNTLSVIQGKKGQHKSRIAETMIISLLSDEEIAGFKKKEGYNPIVILIDTERNVFDQYPFALQKIVNAVGFEGKSNFWTTTVLQFNRKDRFRAITDFTEHVREENPTRDIVVFIDVVTDLVKNFNNVEDSNDLLDYLNINANQYNVTFVCIIHENPSNETEKTARMSGYYLDMV